MESQRSVVLCHKSLGLGLSAVDHRNRLRYPTVAKRAIAARIGMDSVSEELRVLYVAMTRARDRLVMTYASPRLENDLAEIVRRLDMGGSQLLIREAVCPGEWVLLTALQKTEAGALFALADKPRHTEIGLYPWKISVVTAPQPVVDTKTEENRPDVSPEMLADIGQRLNFRYPHAAATATPSKQTATGLKGRQIDQEAAENTAAHKATFRQWRKPGFVQRQSQAADFGNAMHKAMQYLDFAACADEAGVEAELLRLTRQGHLSEEQAELVDAHSIAQFFATELGQKLRQGNVVREFKFSLLVPADAFGEGLDREQVLLQGVVDCALLDDDGIIVIDFKTDAVTEETIAQKQAQYTPQVCSYAQAMERIYRMPVKQRLLYFFRLGRFVSV